MPLAWLLPLLLQSPAAASPAHPQALGKAPDFTLPSIRERRLVSLREFAGKVLYLEVSRSECPRTRAQAADLAELRRKYQDRGFEVLTVADEIFDATRTPVERALEFARASGHEHPIALNDGGEFQSGYYHRVTGTPSGFLVARDGTLELVGEAPLAPSRRDDLERRIETLLDEAPSSRPAANPARERLPDFTLLGIDGGPIRSIDLRGAPAVVAVLTPALASRYGPSLSDLAARYRPLRVRVIAVMLGSFREIVSEVRSRRPAHETAVADADAQRALVGSGALPRVLFVEPDGTILKTLSTFYGRDRGPEAAVFDRYAALIAGGEPADPPASLFADAGWRHRDLGFALDPPSGFRETDATDGAKARFLGPRNQELRIALEPRFGNDSAAAERVADLIGEDVEARRLESRSWREVNGTTSLVLRESWASPLGSVHALRVLAPAREGIYVVTASAPEPEDADARAALERAALSIRLATGGS